MSAKNCFFDKDRVCDLTCKAAFETDDPVDNVDCYFVWATHHIGEGMFEVRRVLEAFGTGGVPFPPGSGPGEGSGGPEPKGPKDNPSQN